MNERVIPEANVRDIVTSTSGASCEQHAFGLAGAGARAITAGKIPTVGGQAQAKLFDHTRREEAKAELRTIRDSDSPLVNATVGKAVKRSLASYIETARNPKGWADAAARAKLHLVPALGHYTVSRLTA